MASRRLNAQRCEIAAHPRALRCENPAMARPDLSDAKLAAMLAVAACAIGLWFAAGAWLPPAWRNPGSPQLYLTGVAGTLLLLVPAAFAFAKRAGYGRSAIGWFNAHVICSTLGMVLIAVHSGLYLRRAPALLLLALVALAVLGTWARIAGARRMAATFASRLPGLRVPDAATRERLKAILVEKRRLLAMLAPQAREGTFSVTLPLLVAKPRLSLAYLRLAREESALLGMRRSLGLAQAWWRPLHLALAWIFVAGVLAHVVTVTFFAGYVADYGPIHWWHLKAW